MVFCRLEDPEELEGSSMCAIERGETLDPSLE
jgi:hypothetical protein